MTLQIKHYVAGLLGISSIALGTLVPGGPIETRSFAHINLLTLGVFNTFLTTLVLSSLLLVYFILQSKPWAMLTATGIGLSYLGVYGLDLAKIFPISPDAMPPALLAIEILGTILSLPLIALSIQTLQTSRQRTLTTVPFPHPNNPHRFQLPQTILVISLGIAALTIITFATSSAMGL
ncbi:hypothetical protein IQ260_13400 [Leptolyngbya cf. ectocarpi LEGE 11479]|uniref:DUF8051 domain-containing protein n=1 Tax=Leptolyngbya cf. ectocarpi LEGE 11479 TaxID=1828722 RepID=A0A928ZUF2_LEPEC|nr:hypothetical protein [Leptolyngbya ectocarpi]MBE9067651.1 hypothetical protein [Leptolyngbya cf. ectocarpi LEGE 11479]